LDNPGRTDRHFCASGELDVDDWVVDGANWQRRSLINPPVTAVHDRSGRGPFTMTED